jgi:hypothetical protein
VLKLIRSTDTVYFDLGNKVLVPSDVLGLTPRAQAR